MRAATTERRRLARLRIAAVALALSSASACAPGPPADDEATFRELEQRLAGAWVQGDRRFIEGLLADDWSVTDPAGRVLTRQQVLEETFGSADRRIEAMSIDEVEVRLLGSVAVVTGRTQAVGSYRGERGAVTVRFTDVFHERDGRWQIVASQGTTVAP